MIDYKLIDDSIRFYDKLGYKRIESPWTVTKAISDITRPDGRGDFSIKEKNKVLVASGEQSFLYLMIKGFLPGGKYQSVTPCFRDEPFDLTHTKYFLKNELIITDEVTENNLDKIVNDAMSFFTSIVKDKTKLWIKNINEIQCDIEYDGYELGSYGIREHGHLKWIYGTGLAEPRTSIILNTKL